MYIVLLVHMLLMIAVQLAMVDSYLFFKQKTAYEVRISDWSSDVCSSDLRLSGAEDRPDLRHVDPCRRHIHGGAAAVRDRHDSGEQYRPDHRVGGGHLEFGSASYRVIVCPYVSISLHAEALIQTNSFSNY